ncbi:MAG: hypothetical protein FWE83_03955, partial [Oscillospiraceae bacterium]|nr:hypothetical protein [Oscillospiraceae bacterium]
FKLVYLIGSEPANTHMRVRTSAASATGTGFFDITGIWVVPPADSGTGTPPGGETGTPPPGGGATAPCIELVPATIITTDLSGIEIWAALAQLDISGRDLRAYTRIVWDIDVKATASGGAAHAIDVPQSDGWGLINSFIFANGSDWGVNNRIHEFGGGNHFSNQTPSNVARIVELNNAARNADYSDTQSRLIIQAGNGNQGNYGTRGGYTGSKGMMTQVIINSVVLVADCTGNCSSCTGGVTTPPPGGGAGGGGDTTTPAEPSACPFCGVVGNWSWGGNEDLHWANGCACPHNAPHFFDANGRCVCGRTGTPSPARQVASACGMCGVVGYWSWGGNAELHWANGCACPHNAPHFFDANGRCICGATGPPSPAVSACGMCGVVGPWRWGGNADVHWADNCNCTLSAPHVFDASGRCICGARRLVAPQDAFLEENFMDSEVVIADILRAIAAGEVPTIDLTNAGNVTIIDADVFLAIAEAGVDVVVVLPSGFTFTIIASSITGDVGAFDLNIGVDVVHTEAQRETLGGGIVNVAENSLVFMPNFHGEFGFEIVFNITAGQLEYAGIESETALHFHVCAVGEVTEKDQPRLNNDGSVDITISHASFHVLSNEAPFTVETGILITESPEVIDEAPDVTTPGDVEQGVSTVPPIQEILAQQSENSFWLLILASTVTILVAVAVTMVMLDRRNRTRRA